MRSSVARAVYDVRNFTQIWLWLYLGRLILALLITLPLLGVIGPSLDRSLTGRTLAGEWSLDVINELIINNPGFVTVYIFLAIFLAIFALFVKQFLNGGIYRTLVNHQRLTGSEFFGCCASDFRGHLKISLVMLPVYIALAVLASLITMAVPSAVFGPQGAGAWLSLFAREWILWMFLIFGSIYSDFMRINLASAPGAAIADNWRSAWRMTRQVGVQAIGIYAVFYLPFVILWIVIEITAVQLTGALQNGLGVVLELLLFQLCAFARTGQSLAGSAGLTHLFQSQTTIPNSVPIGEVEAL